MSDNIVIALENMNISLLSDYIVSDMNYFLVNYNITTKIIEKRNYKNIKILNTNNDEFKDFLDKNKPKFILINITKLLNTVENYVNNSFEHIFVYTNKNIRITNNNCKVTTSVKINKFLSFILNCKETQSIKIENKQSDIKLLENKQFESKENKKYQLKTNIDNKLINNESTNKQSEHKQLKNIQLSINTNKKKTNYTNHKIYKNNKKRFREICCLYLDKYRKIDLPIIELDQENEAVFIEFRRLEHTELLIRNCIIKLGVNWSHTIICNDDTYLFYKNMCKNIDRDIKIINIKRSNMNQNKYNTLLLEKQFWNLCVGEKILIYQEDSYIFKNNINDFMDWDYIGAPFLHDMCLCQHQVGNGGFSLRSKSKMLEILDKVNLIENYYSEMVNSYKNNNNLENYPEDIIFCQNMQTMIIGKVADYESAKKFSIGHIYDENSFGMHCMWDGCKDWEKILNENLKNNIEINVYKNNIKDDVINNIENNNNIGYLNEEYINFTRYFGSSNMDFLKKFEQVDINMITEPVLVIDFFNGGGGTTIFINFIISKYKYYNNFIIARYFNNKVYLTLNDDYIIKIFNSEEIFLKFIENINITKIFVNHLLGYSDHFFNNLYQYKKNKNIKMVTITHDYYMFLNIIQPSYKEIENGIKLQENIDINLFDEIITQHKCNLNMISNKIKNKKKIKIIELPDYYKRETLIKYVNDVKTVGIIGCIINLKGQLQLIELINAMPNIQFVVFGFLNYKKNNLIVNTYKNVKELNSLLINYKPHILLELSLWPETYSYTLTLSLLTNLPLIILDKPSNSVVIERTKEFTSKYIIVKNITEIINHIDLINIEKQQTLYTISNRIQYNKKWNELFIAGYKKNDNCILETKINKLSKYVIYFPQYHAFDVNNHLFYNGFTDIINLNKLQNSNYLNEILTPNFNNFKIQNIENYDIVKNNNIMEQQFKLLIDYKLNGIACYYYWFSENTISNDQMLMRNAVDILFENAKKHNKSIFFIWANENWTNNSAMGNSGVCKTHKILNTYTVDEFTLNFNNMLVYFKNDMYLKHNNKPVLMIYHSFIFEDGHMELFENTLNELCLQYGFLGIHIYWNVMKPLEISNKQFEYNKFYMNFNYKINAGVAYHINKQIVLDYEKYIDFCENDIDNDLVQTLVFDFDNHARLFEPDKTNLSTVCIKNYHFLKIKFIKMILNKYIKKSENDLILINSLNEWGEKMAIEPSNEIGFYYLNLIDKYLN